MTLDSFQAYGQTREQLNDQTEQFKQRNQTEAERSNILFTLAGVGMNVNIFFSFNSIHTVFLLFLFDNVYFISI